MVNHKGRKSAIIFSKKQSSAGKSRADDSSCCNLFDTGLNFSAITGKLRKHVKIYDKHESNATLFWFVCNASPNRWQRLKHPTIQTYATRIRIDVRITEGRLTGPGVQNSFAHHPIPLVGRKIIHRPPDPRRREVGRSEAVDDLTTGRSQRLFMVRLRCQNRRNGDRSGFIARCVIVLCSYYIYTHLAFLRGFVTMAAPAITFSRTTWLQVASFCASSTPDEIVLSQRESSPDGSPSRIVVCNNMLFAPAHKLTQ